MMEEKIWTKKELEQYCKRMFNYVPKFKFIGRKKCNGYRAMANGFTETIELGAKKFNRVLIWHEVGHFLFSNSRFAWKREYQAQIGAIRLALDKGYINIAVDLYKVFDRTFPGDTKYSLAREAIKKELGLDKLKLMMYNIDN